MRNPPWTRDELTLALDFYLQHQPSIPAKTSEQIADLSETLNLLGSITSTAGDMKFRNPNGVYMKPMNFRLFDPNYTGKGLQRGNRDEEVVWNMYSDDTHGLREAASAIRPRVRA